MALVQKKVCMLGATAVGKTSLVRRFVESVFSEKYQATIGVKIDRKLVEVGDTTVSLLLWDLQGEDEIERVRLSYLRGASGFIYVADGTRPETLDTVRTLRAVAEATVGDVPSLLFLNKSDLAEGWALDESAIAASGLGELPTIRTSARTGDQVEVGFQRLVQQLLVS
ncbi:MAG: GTP-binding protein [Gemmatimonadetes bacterium]|nr:GTP-binding protein [Gemmatimonadota bacterium]MCC6773648.1 GTP-binding protein [Gemmatimonadaceae bacterium]